MKKALSVLLVMGMVLAMIPAGVVIASAVNETGSTVNQTVIEPASSPDETSSSDISNENPAVNEPAITAPVGVEGEPSATESTESATIPARAQNESGSGEVTESATATGETAIAASAATQASPGFFS